MQEQSLTKAAMAEKMHASRKQIDRVLAREARSVGRRLKVELV